MFLPSSRFQLETPGTRLHAFPILLHILQVRALATACVVVQPMRGLVLEFETTHGRERQVEWITKPLGVSFDDAMPMLVTEVHEEALHLNVRVGDKLTRYGLAGTLLVQRCLL